MKSHQFWLSSPSRPHDLAIPSLVSDQSSKTMKLSRLSSRQVVHDVDSSLKRRGRFDVVTSHPLAAVWRGTSSCVKAFQFTTSATNKSTQAMDLLGNVATAARKDRVSISIPSSIVKTCYRAAEVHTVIQSAWQQHYPQQAVQLITDMLSTGHSYYANYSSISPSFYQTLLNRSWRRSGTLLYRPNQRKSCCPHYTIRLDSHEFKPSRSQRQVVNRFNKFVLGEQYVTEAARLHPKTREQAKKRDTEFCLTERIHEAEYERLPTPPEPAHRLQVTLEDNSFTEEKYAVWDNYQKVVHGDPPSSRSRDSFKRFLCSSGLRSETTVNEEGSEMRLGSFHQCYRLDGKLVAIGILDLLPQCVSSVYFLYDESIARFAPGKLSALGEIALAQEGGYRWWYPGFYIHSCPKMRYKMEYGPQSILDPESLEWNTLDREVLALLDQKAYVSLAREHRLAGKGNTAGDDKQDETDNALIERGFPGLPTVSEMQSVDLDEIAVKFWKDVDVLLQTTDLGTWDTSSVRDKRGIKRMVAELVGALGVDCVPRLCLDMSKYMDD